MKTNKIILASLMAVGMLFSACTEEAPVREPSPAESNNILAYFAADNATTAEVVPETTFPVVIGRDNVKEAATFELTYDESVEGAFTVNPTVSFAAGDSTAVVEVTLNDAVPAGDVATLSLHIPASAGTVYSVNAASDITIAVTAGYLWVSAGTAVYQSGFCTYAFEQTMAAEVAVQWASNYVSEEGHKLYRLVSPYYYVSYGILCTVEGYHLPFILDKDNNAVAPVMDGLYQIFDQGLLAGIMYMYWVEKYVGSYCIFSNEGDVYTLEVLWSDGSNLYPGSSTFGAPEMFKWTPTVE